MPFVDAKGLGYNTRHLTFCSQEKQDRILRCVEKLLTNSGQPPPAAAAATVRLRQPGCVETALDVGSASLSSVNGNGEGGWDEDVGECGVVGNTNNSTFCEITLSNPPPVLAASKAFSSPEEERTSNLAGVPVGGSDGEKQKYSCGNGSDNGSGGGDGNSGCDFGNKGGGGGGGSISGNTRTGEGGSSGGGRRLKGKIAGMPFFPNLVFVPCSLARRQKRAPPDPPSADLRKGGAATAVRGLSRDLLKDQLKVTSPGGSRSLPNALGFRVKIGPGNRGSPKEGVLACIPAYSSGSQPNRKLTYVSNHSGTDGSPYAGGVGMVGTGLPEDAEEPACADRPGVETQYFFSQVPAAQEIALVDTIGFFGEQAGPSSDLVFPGSQSSWNRPYLGGLGPAAPAVTWGHDSEAVMGPGPAAADGGGWWSLQQ